jgi:hypothetical protein
LKRRGKARIKLSKMLAQLAFPLQSADVRSLMRDTVPLPQNLEKDEIEDDHQG